MKKWFDYLDENTGRRLAECRNIRPDLKTLVQARWDWMKDNGKDKEGFTKEDAFIYIAELLDCNSQWELADLTKDQYNDLLMIIR